VSGSRWRPSAAPEALRARAELLAAVRAFFREAGVLEVETPLCSAFATTDPALDSLETRYTGPGAPHGQRLYLQTSPEFPMKRLLAAGSGPIYQICKALRDGERGRLHNPEFTLLEWYRPGFDHCRLMEEVETLVATVLDCTRPFPRYSYRGLFQQRLGIDPLAAELEELRACALKRGLSEAASLDLKGTDPWLDLLLSRFIEAELGRGTPCFVYDFPASKASLARIRPGDPPVAERFELYAEGLELANGFHELGDPAEQRQRFRRDLDQRRSTGRPEVPMDRHLLDALEHGFPDCAGVALGLDRLLMLRMGANSIDEVLAFPLERA
jgi:lysyl-tRNA synthetase class 2